MDNHPPNMHRGDPLQDNLDHMNTGSELITVMSSAIPKDKNSLSSMSSTYFGILLNLDSHIVKLIFMVNAPN